jgi:hypothetical protein
MAITRIGLNQSINLASNVTGLLPLANGGTAATSVPQDYVKLSTATTTASTSTIEFTGLDTSIYRGYMILIQNLVFASSQNLNMQVGTSSSYLTDQDYNSTILEDNNRTDFAAANTNRGPDGMGNAFSGTMWILPAPNTDIEAAQRALYMYYQ